MYLRVYSFKQKMAEYQQSLIKVNCCDAKFHLLNLYELKFLFHDALSQV